MQFSFCIPPIARSLLAHSLEFIPQNYFNFVKTKNSLNNHGWKKILESLARLCLASFYFYSELQVIYTKSGILLGSFLFGRVFFSSISLIFRVHTMTKPWNINRQSLKRANESEGNWKLSVKTMDKGKTQINWAIIESGKHLI